MPFYFGHVENYYLSMSDEEFQSGGSCREAERVDEQARDPNSEDEYDEEDNDSSRYKKRRNERHGGFILDEAEVDDEVESEDEWEEGAREIGIISYETNEHGPTAREIEGRRRETNLWDFQRENEIEEYLRRKYSGKSMSTRPFGDGSEHMSDEITQQTSLPGVKDPNLWIVKCRTGEEKNTALLLMRKFFAYQMDNPLQIKSIVAPEGVKGYIYIEAYKHPHVMQAIQNIGNLRMGQWKQQMVPIKEMCDVLRVAKAQVGLKQKQWVRLKRGLYKDDIAQVDFVDTAQNEVRLKLLPRIDYTRLRGAFTVSKDSDALKRKKKHRPLAKPFDSEAIRAIGGDVTINGDFKIFEGNRYSSEGFLYKNFNINAIIADGIKPTLSELEKFEEAPEGVDIELPASSKDDASTHSFCTGDNVEVCQGELMHLQGKILSIDGNFITVMPKHEDLKISLEFQADELKKYFKIGDHAKVISGRYKGDTGLIIRILENRVFLFLDLRMHELEILPRDLQMCSDMATGVDSLGQFQYGDLVKLDAQTVGVIVWLDREIFRVLSMNGKVVEVKPQALHKKKENRNIIALDSDQQKIQRRDIVKVIDGPHSGRGGEIKHLYRTYAFLYSKLYSDNGGIFVCKTRHLQLAGGSKSNSMTTNLNSGFMSPRISSPMNSSGGGGGRRRGREIVGQTIKITRGPYKGNVGIVKDITNTTARVELHTSCQTIFVEKNNIMVLGAPTKAGFETCQRTPFGINQTPLYPGRTPTHGSQTPLYESGSRTPHYYGGATPLHDGSRTPGAAWDPTVLNTPSRQSELDRFTLDDSYDATKNVDYVPQSPRNNYGSSKNSFSGYHQS